MCERGANGTGGEEEEENKTIIIITKKNNDDSVKGSDGSRKDFVRRAKERRGEIKAEAAGAVEAPAERNGKLTNPFEKIIAL